MIARPSSTISLRACSPHPQGATSGTASISKDGRPAQHVLSDHRRRNGAVAISAPVQPRRCFNLVSRMEPASSSYGAKPQQITEPLFSPLHLQHSVPRLRSST